MNVAFCSSFKYSTNISFKSNCSQESKLFDIFRRNKCCFIHRIKMYFTEKHDIISLHTFNGGTDYEKQKQLLEKSQKKTEYRLKK